jgi:hypothetical protein
VKGIPDIGVKRKRSLKRKVEGKAGTPEKKRMKIRKCGKRYIQSRRQASQSCKKGGPGGLVIQYAYEMHCIALRCDALFLST